MYLWYKVFSRYLNISSGQGKVTEKPTAIFKETRSKRKKERERERGREREREREN